MVVTGTFEEFSKTSIKDKLEILSAKVSGSVSKKTDYALYGKEAWSKLDNALELCVRTISEKNLYL